MSKPPKTSRRGPDVEGVILPDAVYDTDAVLRAAGIGRGELVKLKRDGVLRCGMYKGHGRAWYRGKDLIDLIFGKGE